MIITTITDNPRTNPMTWQQDLTGQVLDAASLNLFWFELTTGAYGQIERVGAIVEVVDGSAWHLGFEQSHDPVETELPVERWLTGRPTRPSSIEVVGADLDVIGIATTLKQCGLSDDVLANYQAQLRSKG
jgi:hypothetical protein